MDRRYRLLLVILCIFILSGCSSPEGKTTDYGERRGEPKVRLLLGGSGSNIGLTAILAQKFMQKNPGVQIDVTSSIGSHGGVQKTADGLLDLGMVSRDLTAEEDALRLTRIPYARAAVVVAVNPGVKVSSLTYQQFIDIYSGKIRNWREVGGEDRPITVLSREPNDSSRLVFNRHIPGFAGIEVLPEAVLLRTDQDMNEAIQSVTDAIGWTDLGALRVENLSVKPIVLNNYAPTEKNLRSGKYPFIKELSFVTGKLPKAEVKKFIAFVNSWEGKRIIMENGYLPVE